MDRCQRMEERISLRLDGMLDPEEEQELEAHLAHCPACRALARELEAIRAAFPEVEEYRAPEGFARGVMDRVAALEEKPKVVPLLRRPQVRALMGMAACAVLCVGLYQSGLWNRSADGAGIQAQSAASAGTSLQAIDEDLPRSGMKNMEDTTAEGDQESLDSAPYAQVPKDGLSDEGTETQVPNNSLAGEGADALEPEPSQFQASDASALTVAGQAVAAVLTVDRLPQGWEDVLGSAPEWTADEAGRTCCIITADQLTQLEALAQEAGISASLAGRTSGDEPCALVVLEET